VTEQEERDLIIAAREGNQEAFDLLVRESDRLVLSQALHFTRDREKALDVYQEAFLRAHRSLGQFRFDCRFSTWMRKITTNVCLTEFSKEKRLNSRMFVNSQLAKPRSDGDADPTPLDRAESGIPDSFRQVASGEIRGRIEQVIMELPPQQRMVFVLRHFEGEKLKDIAGILEIATGTAKKHLFEAIRKMRESLREYEGLA